MSAHAPAAQLCPLRSAVVTEHERSSKFNLQPSTHAKVFMIRAVTSSGSVCSELLRSPSKSNDCCQPRKRKGHPATWAASSSRENSSNGVLNRQNFLAKSYEPKKQGVKEFLGNKWLLFQ